MKEQAARLADARLKHTELAAIYANQKRQWEESVAELSGFLAEAGTELMLAEESLRASGLSYYEANPGTKKLPYGVGIRVIETMLYESSDALTWAIEHNMALALDKKAFEKIAKVSPPEFVTVGEVLTVTLPSDSAKLMNP